MKKSKLILAFKMALTHFMVGYAITLYPLFWLFNSSDFIMNYVEELKLELNNIDKQIDNL